MMATTAPDLALAEAQGKLLSHSADTAEIEACLGVVSDASADLGRRAGLQSHLLFERLLEMYASLYATKPPPKSLLRCIGNLVSDNDTNRASLISHSGCITKLKSLLLEYTTDQPDTVLADFAIKIFFNLCNDSEQVQQQALEQNIDKAVIGYVHTRKWTESDEALLSITAALLASLIEHKPQVRPSEDYTQDSISDILRLPSIKHWDSDAFLEVLQVVCGYLQDEQFVQQTVEYKQVHLVWGVLVLTEAMRRKADDEDDEDEDEDEEEENDESDEKLYRQTLTVIGQGLADMSSSDAFNKQYSVDDQFIKDLCAACIPTESDDQQRSMTAGCACLILGNLAITDDVSTALVPDMIDVRMLFQKLGTSSETIFLNAAAGLLRHLATPMTNRELYFGGAEFLQQVAHLYTEATLDQVQTGGLQLIRQMISNIPERAEGMILESSDSRTSISTILGVFEKTSAMATKLEVARLLCALLRTLQSRKAEAKSFETSLRALEKMPNVLSPFMFAIKQAPNPGVMTAQAEAWLGLNLFARGPDGARIVAEEVDGEDEVLELLRNRIKKGNGDGGVAGQSEDNRPDWVKDKERDNAVLLMHDICRAENVSEKVRGKVRGLLDEAAIRVQETERAQAG